MKKSRILFEIEFYSPSFFLSKIKEEAITIYDFQKVDEYRYRFSTSFFERKKVLKVFPYAKIIQKEGLLAIGENLFKRKTTIFALILSLLLFYLFTHSIYQIEVVGPSASLNASIYQKLDELGVKKYQRLLSYQQLENYQKELKTYFYQEIETLEVYQEGVKLVVRYEKRREGVILPSKTGPKYAKKRGIISHFIVSSGLLMVKENQFVLEGDLLIDDTIETPKGEKVVVGAEGRVYAHTWTLITVQMEAKNEEESEIYSQLLLEGEHQMTKNFVDEEKIEEEKILNFEKEDHLYTMKIHFTCLEDIAKVE